MFSWTKVLTRETEIVSFILFFSIFDDCLTSFNLQPGVKKHFFYLQHQNRGKIILQYCKRKFVCLQSTNMLFDMFLKKLKIVYMVGCLKLRTRICKKQRTRKRKPKRQKDRKTEWQKDRKIERKKKRKRKNWQTGR